MPGAPTENPGLHLPSEPAMDAVLTPYHEGMVPARGLKESTSEAEYDPTEDQLIGYGFFARGEKPGAIWVIPCEVPSPRGPWAGQDSEMDYIGAVRDEDRITDLPSASPAVHQEP